MSFTYRSLLIGLLACGIAVTASEPVVAQEQANATSTSSGQIVTHLKLRKGTADYEHARAWVRDAVRRSGTRFGTVANLERDALGDVLYVTITHNVDDKLLSASSGPVLPSPPWTPGFSGYSVGDTVSITTTSGGWTQTWSLVLALSTSGTLVWNTMQYSATRHDRPR